MPSHQTALLVEMIADEPVSDEIEFEGSKRHEIRALMVVKSSQVELYELEANTGPVIVQRLD